MIVMGASKISPEITSKRNEKEIKEIVHFISVSMNSQITNHMIKKIETANRGDLRT